MSADGLVSRSVRVFISSTFRDMQADRDYLVKFTFPELRKYCLSRGVTWVEVDLRWGVTDEQKAEGQVLPICLEEIRRCRPYFIGLLGERYGWIPDSGAIPIAIVDRAPWLREHLQARKSVTELEMLHGVLHDKTMRAHAYFYFRDPRSIETMPQDQQADFTSENSESAERLRRLKGAIRQARDEGSCALREGYRDPKELGDWIRDDFEQLIDTLFPEGSPLDSLDREALDHQAYARSRESVYIGRGEYFESLTAHASATDARSLAVLGESGSGKSALLANWVSRYQREHPDVLVLQHYIGATPYSADWAAMVRRILEEFKRRLGLQGDIPDEPKALRDAFPNWLHRAAAKKRIVLVLDALNQLEDREGAPDLVWLPPVLPEGVRLIASTLPGRALDEIRRRQWAELTIRPLDMVERRKLISGYLAQLAKNLSPRHIDLIAGASQSENPLFLRVLLNELRILGKHEDLEFRIAGYLQATSPAELYRRIIVRWEEDYGAGMGLVGESLSLLWAARRGLTEAELLQLLGGGGVPLPRTLWSPLYLAMDDALVDRNGFIGFSHDFLRKAIAAAYLTTEPSRQSLHLRLADYFCEQPPSFRRTEELPWQFARAKAWARLSAVLADPDDFLAAWAANKGDVKSYWAQVEGNSPLRMETAYDAIVKNPGAYPEVIHDLALLFHDSGRLKSAWILSEFLLGQSSPDQEYGRRIDALNLSAAILRTSGDLGGAQKLAEQALAIARKQDDWIYETILLGQLGALLGQMGKLDAALGYLKENERVFRERGVTQGLQQCLGNQAVILTQLGRPEEALKLHQEEERLCSETDDLDNLAVSWMNQAGIWRQGGRIGEATRLYARAESAFRTLGQRNRLQRVLGAQADILREQNALEEAMEKYQEKEALARELGSLPDVAMCLERQAIIRKMWGDLDGAMQLLSEQERICRALGDQAGMVNIFINRANLLRRRREFTEALNMMRQAERLCRETGNRESLATCLANMGVLLKDQLRQPQQALPVLQEAYGLAVNLGLGPMAISILEELQELGALND